MQREAVVSSSAPHGADGEWLVKVGVTQAHRHCALDCRAEERWEPLPSVTLFLGKSKANPSLSAVPSSSSSQAPWWHQPCFCNYLTSVVQISNEPARVTNTHISPAKLSPHQTGGWPSGVNSAFRSLLGLCLGEHSMKSNIPGKPRAVAVSVLLPEGCRCSRYLLFLISVFHFAVLPSNSGSCSHSSQKHGKSSFS